MRKWNLEEGSYTGGSEKHVTEGSGNGEFPLIGAP
jgi:hypothetical protein